MSKPLEFYQLERPPFEDGVRDAAAVGTRPLRAALERARRFIEAETAVVCVKGRSGIGKTYFGLALPSVLPAGTLIARIGQPAQPWSALHAAIAKGFDLDPHSFSVDALHELRDQERRLVIEIDPVEQLQLDAFTPLLSLLSHAYLPERRLVQAVLIGDFAALPEAAREGLAALGSATLELEALPVPDVPSYVQKRLDRAGYRGQALFSRAACEEVRVRAEGVPREVNRICTLALELAAERRAQVIEPEVIRDACSAAPAPAAGAPAPAAPAAEPAAASPRAVIGRMKLKARTQAPAPKPPPAPSAAATAGQARRIEPLPPDPEPLEPVVQAEPETPLMDAVFVDEEAEVAPAPPAPAPARAAVRSPAPEVAPVRRAPVVAEPPPLPVEPVRPAPAVVVAPPPVEPTPQAPREPVAAPVQVAAELIRAPVPEAAPPPARKERAFPWLHVGISLAASWAIAAGLFWLYQRQTPEAPQGPTPAPALVESEPARFAENSVPIEQSPPAEPASPAIAPPSEPAAAPVQIASAAPSAPQAAAEPAAPVAQPPPPASPPAAPAAAPAATPTPTEVVARPQAPRPGTPAQAPAQTAPVATALVQTPAPASPAPASAPSPAPATRKAAAPPPPPLHVELRPRGREVLYPPRPASAYIMPAQ